MLQTLVVLLAATVLLIPLSRRAGFGSVLGYLAAGILIGPSGLRLITDVDEIREISELGVVMLLFLIGLELRPQRLWVMRRSVLGMGAAQVIVTGALLALLAYWRGLDWVGAGAIGAGLALSSTAIVLPMLSERDLLGSVAGRDSFAVLLFQDLAFIPLVAAVPLLVGERPTHAPWHEVAQGVGAIAALLIGGRFIIRPAFRAIGGARIPEVFNAMALLVVIGAAATANAFGLSMSLGAFLAGVNMSDSEYRHELRADIEPFEGLLLGFFFMSVGMSANLGLVITEPGRIAIAVAALMAVKIVVAYAIGRISRQDNRSAIRFAMAMPQGSEFSFVLFAAALGVGALDQDSADRATLVVTLSMVMTPILFAVSERLVIPRFTPKTKPVYDTVHDDHTPVIICGFGRVGQIVGRVLRMHGIPFTALENDPAQVDVVRRFGTKVYYGEPTRPDVLRAAGAEHAQLLVVAISDIEESLRIVDMARRNFPKLKIVSRARNRRHAHLLMDRGITGFVRETLHSSLKLSEIALGSIGVAQDEARRAVEMFAEHDERFLRQSYSFHDDERQMIQSAQQAAAELVDLFEADHRRREQQESEAQQSASISDASSAQPGE
ncbi:MAG TPA: monovalent cation:proton antiporter-2 (CPA2) family protein [Magnetospirillaceae bacterium]|jgi:CPA2 family monovalent cation:H+ antiporter-2/glutathione-regulated potassium-efflux system protein KefB